MLSNGENSPSASLTPPVLLLSKGHVAPESARASACSKCARWIEPVRPPWARENQSKVSVHNDESIYGAWSWPQAFTAPYSVPFGTCKQEIRTRHHDIYIHINQKAQLPITCVSETVLTVTFGFCSLLGLLENWLFVLVLLVENPTKNNSMEFVSVYCPSS